MLTQMQKTVSSAGFLCFFRRCSTFRPSKRISNESLQDVDSCGLPLPNEVTSIPGGLPVNTSCGQQKKTCTFEDLADACTPLWKIPYKDQLVIKNQRIHEMMKRLTSKLTSSKGEIICKLTDIIPSPTEQHYRNKDEFHARYSPTGEPVVGLCVGHPSDSSLQCINAEGLLNTKPVHSAVARHFQRYLAQSKWRLCEHFQKGGNWRHLIVRSNSLNELMMIVVIHPQNLETEEIHEEMLRMKDYMLNCSIDNLRSMYYQSCVHTKCTAEQSPFILLHGETHIYEQIGQHKFRISPESFFQVNTEGARVLYEVVAKQLKPNRMSTVLDLCCGTGTQGITVASKCRSVVGIEVSHSAIQDAKFNAQLNGILNAEFYAGRVEQVFGQVLERLALCPEIDAIINPGRAGVGHEVIRLLRENERIRRLVYVSCQPDGPAMKNFVALCQRSGKKVKGKPFYLGKAIPIDMFPHTNHCEMVLTFHR